MGLIKLMDNVRLLWLTLRKHWTQVKCFKGCNEGFRNQWVTLKFSFPQNQAFFFSRLGFHKGHEQLDSR